MTPALDAHLKLMHCHAMFIGSLADALQHGVLDPPRREVMFAMLDAIGDLANELGIGLDASTLSKVESKTDVAT